MSLSLPMSLSQFLTSGAFAPIQNVGWIRVSGSDRVRWLNGMVTNNIQALKPGEGCYNFFLNAQGRIQGDATAWLLEDSILLETAADRVPALLAMLDHFIIMDDVELEDLTSTRSGILLAGRTMTIGGEAGGPDPALLPLTLSRSPSIDFLHAHSPLIPRYELWTTPDYTAKLCAEFKATFPQATPEALEQLRILEGTPLYGTDIRNAETAKDLPQETAQTRALHFSKGCYLGQEIVERIRSRGNVHRTFSGFILIGEQPAPGAILSSEEKPVGELTSVTRIELSGGAIQLALGYIRRETLDRNTTISYPGGTATPAALPFQLPESRA